MNTYRDTLTRFVPFAVALTAMTGLIYLAGQQQYRSSLNDPQTQLVRDTARLVEAGVSPETLAPRGSAIEISESLAPWIVFYDSALTPTASTGLLHGVIPQIPAGVFAAADAAGEDILTWQPEAGVRQALVIRPMGDEGYVVAGRSMSAVDERTRNLGIVLVLGWLVALAATLLGIHYAARLARMVA